MKKIAIIILAMAMGLTSVFAQKYTTTNMNREKTFMEKGAKVHDKLVWYQGELNFGFATGGKMKFDNGYKEPTNYSRAYIETIHGVRITQYAFAGLGLGVQYAFGKLSKEYPDRWNTIMMPIFFNMKGMYPVTENFAPYVSISLGGTVSPFSGYFNDTYYGDRYDDYDVAKEKLRGKFYGEYAVGLQYKKFNFSFGLQQQYMAWHWIEDGVDYGDDGERWNINSFFVKIGVKF